MSRDFDPGYGLAPYDTLVRDCPGSEVFPTKDFRTEWGPIFHRGRLDGSARVLVLGQDPATHETVVRRILVGEAGQRVQGLLRKLGIDQSYAMINTFVYSVYGQGGGSKHKADPAIAAYRHQWLDALFAPGKIEAVLALGTLADAAWGQWVAARGGAPAGVAYRKITHPTQPESSAGNNAAKHAAAIKKMLENWNGALGALHPAIAHKDVNRPLVLYGGAFASGDRAEIPAMDLPAGIPPWMGGLETWAQRKGSSSAGKRATLVVTVPKGSRP